MAEVIWGLVGGVMVLGVDSAIVDAKLISLVCFLYLCFVVRPRVLESGFQWNTKEGGGDESTYLNGLARLNIQLQCSNGCGNHPPFVLDIQVIG